MTGQNAWSLIRNVYTARLPHTVILRGQKNRAGSIFLPREMRVVSNKAYKDHWEQKEKKPTKRCGMPASAQYSKVFTGAQLQCDGGL